MFQMVEQARQSQNNPVDFFKQLTQNKTPQEMEYFYKTAKQYGVPDEIIQQVQNNN